MTELVLNWVLENPWILVPIISSVLGWRIIRQREPKFKNWREY